VSTAELERRWAAVREIMADAGVEVLVMQANNDYMGGYVRYFTDLPAENGYPVTVVFPREEEMTVVRHGPLGEFLQIPPGGDGVLRGVKTALHTSHFVSASFSRHYDAELVTKALRPWADTTIGVLGSASISMATADYLRAELHRANFVHLDDEVDAVRAVKSEEERDHIRATARLQDAAMAAAFAAVEPGRRDCEIASIAQHCATNLGSEQGIYWCNSTPPGQPGRTASRHSQNRVMQEGDIFQLMIETNGPAGMYTEIGRTCVLGRAPQQLVEEYEFSLAAQDFCVSLMSPGKSAAEAAEAYNAFMRDNGRNEEKRIHCHGQGTDLVERPLVRHDENWVLREHMNIAVHPRHVRNGFSSWVCDNFLITSDNQSEHLHQFDRALVEL